MRSFNPLSLALLTLLCWNCPPAFSQTPDSATAVGKPAASPEKDHFLIGAIYNSGLNYYGRVDSLKSKGICPFAGLSFKNGLYLDATFIFIHNDLQSQYAASVLEGGYNLKDKKENWSGTFSASRYFYQGNTDLIQSVVKEVVTATISNLNKIVNITLGADARFSDKLDPGIQVGLDHIIRFPHIFGNGVIVLDPAANVYAGTQNFTRTYEQQKDLLIFPVGQDQVTTNSREFNILSYEFSMPLVYGYKKTNLILAPAYVLPQHILPVPGQSGSFQQGNGLFYVTATLKFTL